MEHLKPNHDTGSLADNAFSAAGRNSSQTGELALAAAEVVFRRMALGGFALINPLGADHAEFARMVPEKAKAFSASGSILLSQSAQIGQEVARIVAAEATRATAVVGTVLTGRTPGGAIAIQARAAMAWAERLAAQSGALCLLVLEAQAAVLAPIHRAATDNLERLRN